SRPPPPPGLSLTTSPSCHTSMLLPAYRPLLRCHTPKQRTITVWPSDAVPALQDCFQCTDWQIFREAAACEGEVDLEESIHRLSSDTSASAQRTSPAPGQSGDRLALRAARRQLTAGVKRAKAAYAQRIQGHFTSNDPRSMWRGIKCITDYNTRDAQCPRDPSLPDALNNFYARFDDPNTSPSTRFTPPPGEEPLRVTAAEVRRTLQRINPRKAAGPDNISGRVLKGCAYQLTEVLTDIFNTSLQQAAVPTCLKTATIIPIPKTQTAVCEDPRRLLLLHQPQHRLPPGLYVLSPLLFTLLTHDCSAIHPSCLIVKFADDTAVVGRITKANNDESDYRQEVEHLEGWCRQNNLCINVKKTKEMIVDFRRGRHLPSPLHIGGTAVEVVSSFRYLGVHISDDLTWSKNTSCLIRKAHQRLYFLRRLRRAGLGSSVLTSFYRCVVESVLSSCIIVWHGSCSAAEKKALQRVVKAAQRTVGRSLPTTTDIYTFQMQETGLLHHEGPHSHCTHELFAPPLPSGRRLRSIKSRTTRLRNSFFFRKL
ncbi:hypothetical protein L3Q82_017900, partial [Scortum barcoo]